jgi:hypothetical protein
MNSTYTEELKQALADEDALIVKTFTDTGYKVSVETDGLGFFGTHETQDEIDKEILEHLKALQ